MGITVNNKHSKLFGDYISCTAYEASNLPETVNYEIAGGEISTYMPTTILANSYNLYFGDNSYVKYASSAYTLVTEDGNYSYATFDGFLSSYSSEINNALDGVEDTGYIYVAKSGTKDNAKTETALGYVDLKIDIIY